MLLENISAWLTLSSGVNQGLIKEVIIFIHNRKKLCPWLCGKKLVMKLWTVLENFKTIWKLENNVPKMTTINNLMINFFFNYFSLLHAIRFQVTMRESINILSWRSSISVLNINMHESRWKELWLNLENQKEEIRPHLLFVSLVSCKYSHFSFAQIPLS